MQMNGIGGSHSDMHHVTNCIHDHKHRLEGNLGAMGGNGAGKKPEATSTLQQMKEPFSLTAWLQNTVADARTLWGKIGIFGTESGQNGNELSVKPQVGAVWQTGAETALVQEEALASSLVQPNALNDNPYFATVSDATTTRYTVWQKIKIRFRDVSGFLAKRFAFSDNGAFQTGQQRSKEDMRRRSNFRKDEAEIECVLTDDSYLLDSYNRKGEYSRLSAEK